MTSYRVKEGHDIILANLTVLSPQPEEEHGGGIQYTRIGDSADGSIYKQGPYFPFVWKEMTAAQLATILALFGVDDQDSANVTIYVRDETLATWVRKNGVAKRPIPGDTIRWKNRPVNVTIMVVNLVTSS